MTKKDIKIITEIEKVKRNLRGYQLLVNESGNIYARSSAKSCIGEMHELSLKLSHEAHMEYYDYPHPNDKTKGWRK